MNKIKCSNGCVYSRTMNQIYPRLCVNCGGRELVSLDQKWRSPTGASIANHETDKLPPLASIRETVIEGDIKLSVNGVEHHIPDGGRMVSKTMNNLKQVRDALEALLNYQQADRDGIMVLTSRQAIHEVADYVKATLSRMIETPAPQGFKLVTFGHLGAKWSANETKEIWKEYADKINIMLSAAPTPAPPETLATESEQLRKERDELAMALKEYYIMYGDRSIISSVDDLLEKAGILND